MHVTIALPARMRIRVAHSRAKATAHRTDACARSPSRAPRRDTRGDTREVSTAARGDAPGPTPGTSGSQPPPRSAAPTFSAWRARTKLSRRLVKIIAALGAGSHQEGHRHRHTVHANPTGPRVHADPAPPMRAAETNRAADTCGPGRKKQKENLGFPQAIYLNQPRC